MLTSQNQEEESKYPETIRSKHENQQKCEKWDERRRLRYTAASTTACNREFPSSFKNQIQKWKIAINTTEEKNDGIKKIALPRESGMGATRVEKMRTNWRCRRILKRGTSWNCSRGGENRPRERSASPRHFFDFGLFRAYCEIARNLKLDVQTIRTKKKLNPRLGNRV